MSLNSTAEAGAGTRCCNATTLFATAASSFFFCLLFVLFFLCLRFALLRRRWRHSARVLQEEQQQRPKLGLDAAAIALLPSFPFPPSAGTALAGAGSDAECAVCLYALDEGQMVRQLPGCKHVFHQECIDVWLASRASCPVCRAKAEPGRAEGTTASASVVLTIEVPNDEIAASSSTPGETEAERALWTRSEAGSSMV
jgi:E3 ubiquitin-protein ligase ATL41